MVREKVTKWIQILFDPVFIYLAIAANFLLLMATIAVYLIEHDTNPMIKTYFDSLWWGITTITTIGYGDVIPITSLGRIVGILLMITGPVLFVLFTGVLLRSFLRAEVEKEIDPIDRQLKKERRENRHIEAILEQINKRFDRLENQNRK